MEEIKRLKKTIENRESTITFLNELLDGQSRKIESLNEKLEAYEIDNQELIKKIEQLQSLNDALQSLNDTLTRQVEYYMEVFDNAINENKTIKNKLSVLVNAFESIKEPSEPQNVKVSNDKEQHDKELNHPQWKKKREEVFERYGKQCVECGKTKNIEVHHLIYRKGRHLWEYDTSELIPLCRKCHKKVHEDKTHRFHEKYVG